MHGWRWCKRQHPKKNTKWVRKRYFKTIKGNKWTFATTISDRRGKEKIITLYQIAYTPIERHIKVKGNTSPDNPLQQQYWLNRNQRLGKSYWSKGSKYYSVAQNQNWTCPICGELLLNGEEIETHHIVPVAKGGTDDEYNLQHVHLACHKQVHSQNQKPVSKGLKLGLSRVSTKVLSTVLRGGESSDARTLPDRGRSGNAPIDSNIA